MVHQRIRRGLNGFSMFMTLNCHPYNPPPCWTGALEPGRANTERWLMNWGYAEYLRTCLQVGRLG
jgi:hypothetical protein